MVLPKEIQIPESASSEELNSWSQWTLVVGSPDPITWAISVLVALWSYEQL